MASTDEYEEQTLSIPSLIFVAVLGFFAIRYFMSSRSASSASRTSTRGRRINPDQVEHIAQMFPQLSRRDIVWDLQRNGGSVAATTERILTGHGLETPPQSFQPEIPAPSTPVASATTSAPAKPPNPDLITKYNLQSKLRTDQAETSAMESSPNAGGSGWSANKTERQQMLQRRRDEMILAARRKMEERDKGKRPA